VAESSAFAVSDIRGLSIADGILLGVVIGEDTVDATAFGPVRRNVLTFSPTRDSSGSVAELGVLGDSDCSDETEETLLRLLVIFSNQFVRLPSFSSGCALIACLSTHQRGMVLKPSSLSFVRSGISCLYRHPCCV